MTQMANICGRINKGIGNVHVQYQNLLVPSAHTRTLKHRHGLAGLRNTSCLCYFICKQKLKMKNDNLFPLY